MPEVLVGNQVLDWAPSAGFSAGPICSSTKIEISPFRHSVGINSLSELIGPANATTLTINIYRKHRYVARTLAWNASSGCAREVLKR